VAAPTRPEDPPTPPPELEAGECPRCGAPLEPLQEYCLDCGLRLPGSPTGLLATLGDSWRRRLRWYPGDWIWVALGLLAIAAVGAAVAVAASRENSQLSTIVATTTPGVITRQAVNTTPPTTPPPATPTSATAAPPAPTPPAAPRGQSKLRLWPSGQSGWTVVLRSETSEATARAQARRAIRAGLRDVGVLNSSNYSSLHPGYFVVWSGVYDAQADAQAALAAATSAGYAGANVRPVSP
jgi:hypothetical protein